MRDPYVLYGAPVSLYTGKARSYLRKQGIPFVEVSPGSDRYLHEVVPVVGRWIIPVLETPDGELVQDSADIIDHFERDGSPTRYPAYPVTPLHLAVSHVFELFGGEGLLRPAMHYRWSFDDENLAFLEDEFVAGLFPGLPADAAASEFERSSRRMRRAAVSFGVLPETMPLIETAFQEWLELFDAHLAGSPYLLGGRPTLGDYGLMAAMWAHLFRDPAPVAVVKRVTPRVGRWVERMSTAEPGDSEYGRTGSPGTELFAEDELPATIDAMLAFVADELLPEVAAHVEHANRWLADRPDLVAGTNGLEHPGARAIGSATFEWRGTSLTTGVLPYRFWLLQRLQRAASSSPAEEERVRSRFRRSGLEPLLDLRTHRPVERVDHLEVWGDSIDAIDGTT